jgi:hypothetical protein
VNRPCTGGCVPSHTDLGLCTWGRLTDAKEAHILVTGYSNVAVDNIFLGLRAMGVAALRVRSAGGALVGTNELAAVPGTIQFELSRHQKTHLAASLRSQKKMEQVWTCSITPFTYTPVVCSRVFSATSRRSAFWVQVAGSCRLPFPHPTSPHTPAPHLQTDPILRRAARETGLGLTQ